ncbi:hypothetical protein EDB80DRAFT_898825 [Ilyonectria destructans]|nr:hypothetical protein EDB80DRAFT_898825 [Ilyonectria destructans]
MDNLQRLARIPRKDLPDLRDVARSRLNEREMPKGQALDWSQRGKILDLKTEKEGASFELVQSSFDVWICSRLALDRLGCPMYVELAFKETPAKSLKETALAFFNGIKMDDSVFRDGIKRLEDGGIRSVYIAAEFAHPLGYFFHQLPRRPERLKALLIAFIGRTNPVCCRSCVKSYKGTVTSNKEHILIPFATCCSEAGFMSVAAAVSGQRLTKHSLDFPLLGAGTATTAPQPVSQFPDLLNRLTCPRVTQSWPSIAGDRRKERRDVEVALAVSRQDKNKGYQGAMVDLLE